MMQATQPSKSNHMRCGVCKKERPMLGATYFVIGAVGRLHAPNSYMFCPDCFAEMAGVDHVEKLFYGAQRAISNETLVCGSCNTIFIEHVPLDRIGQPCPRTRVGCEGMLIPAQNHWKSKISAGLEMKDVGIYLDDYDKK